MNINSKEMQHIAQVMANEKGLTSQQVLSALERAINKASKNENAIPIDAHVASRQLSLKTKQIFAREIDGLALKAKIVQILSRPVSLITGLARQITTSHVKIEAEGFMFFLSKEQFLPMDYFKIGDKISFIPEAKEDQEGVVVGIALRNDEFFIRECIKNEIIQIEEGDLCIKKIAREPGKICHVAIDGRLRKNAVSIAVGAKGAHTKAISMTLKGERIEFLLWEEDPLNRLVSGMQGVDLVRISIDEDTQEATLIVTDDTIINDAIKTAAKLAGEMAGLSTIIANESEMAARENDDIEFLHNELKNVFGDDNARQLIQSGFESLEDVAWRPAGEWPIELKSQTTLWVASARSAIEEQQLKPFTQLGLSNNEATILFNQKINSINALADLATDELLELLPTLEISKASHMIMQARNIL